MYLWDLVSVESPLWKRYYKQPVCVCSEDYTVKKVVKIVLISLVKHIFKIAYLMISVASIRLKNLMTALNCKKKNQTKNNYSMLTIFSNWLPVIDCEFLQWSLKLGISAVQDWKKKLVSIRNQVNTQGRFCQTPMQ